MASLDPRPFDVKRIAIIGAGPCGLSAAKYLVAQDAFEQIVVYEKQPEVGGIWYYTDAPSPTLHVPQVSASCPPDPPVRPDHGPPVFPTPMYGLLHTNIPHTLMQYSDFPFRNEPLIFPSREHVQDYLVAYAGDVRHLIRFSTQVAHVRLRREGGRERWDVDALSVHTGEKSTATYDAIVVASGHYATTYVPDIPGIRAFHRAHPEIIIHSKLYRHARAYTGKKVVVVGNAASGLDIATQIGRVSQKPVLLSVRTPSLPDALAFSGAEELPQIVEFLENERGVKFKDGRVEKDIDAVIFSTGYLFTFPFFRTLDLHFVTDGRRVRGLYKHLFSIDHPTLVFPGLPIKVIPFPMSESEAAFFSRVWACELHLPTQREMREWEDEESEKARREDRGFHVFPKGGDGEYINSTYEMVASSGTPGKLPPKWNEERLWERSIYAEAKLKFEMEGRKAKSLGELGFHFTPGPRENAAEAMER